MTMAPAQTAPPIPAGTTPPHSIEAEQAVLGAILLSEKAHYTFIVEQELTAADFYRSRHQVAFEVMAGLFSAGVDLDVLSVTEELKAQGKLEEAGGADEIAGLVTAVPAVGNLRRYAQIVKELAHLRRLLDASYRIQSSVFARDGEPSDIVDEAERAILDIRMGGDGKDFRPVGEVLEEEITRWQALAEGGNSITGVRSGFDDLDTITGGFQPGNLIILAARPSMGKSALVTNIAENVALDKRDPRPVALFSLEMSEGELAQRFVASQAVDQGRRPAQGQGQAGAVEARPDRRRRLRPLEALHRRLVGHQPARHPRQGAPPAPELPRPGRPRPDHHRLPPADAGRHALRQPRAAGRRDEPRAEDPRA